MASPTQIAKLFRRGLTAAMGPTAPQEAVGLIGLLKNAATGNASNMRLGPEGEVMYDAKDPAAAASAMGSFVQTDPSGTANDPDVLKHEMRHVRQSDVLGPLFMPAAIREGVMGARGKYGAGPMERDAIQHATPQSEMLRKGSSMYQPNLDPNALALLQGLMGR